MRALLFIFCFFLSTLVGETIHEAFLSPAGGQILLDAVPTQPPPPLQEKAPAPIDPREQWISGYWIFDEQINTFSWICGVYRKPPPHRFWIPGDWQNFPEGWVRVPGFWSDTPLPKIVGAPNPPPASLDENVPNPPNPNFFWSPGYWQYNSQQGQYRWVAGQWESFNPEQVFVSPYYVWREQGYILVSGHWDWPIDQIGHAYCTTPSSPPSQAPFTPTQVVEVNVIIENYFVDYPTYSNYYWHHWHYHPDYWDHYCCTPPWWNWNGWWAFTWHDKWALWWWYSHPGFPAPVWMNAEMSKKIAPPDKDLLHKMSAIRPPRIVTPHGVVSPHKLIQSIEKTHPKSRLPIFNRNNIKQAVDNLSKEIKPQENFRPSGKKEDKLIVPKPLIDVQTPAQKPRPITLPPSSIDNSTKNVPLNPPQERPIRTIENKIDTNKPLDHDVNTIKIPPAPKNQPLQIIQQPLRNDTHDQIQEKEMQQPIQRSVTPPTREIQVQEKQIEPIQQIQLPSSPPVDVQMPRSSSQTIRRMPSSESFQKQSFTPPVHSEQSKESNKQDN